MKVCWTPWLATVSCAGAALITVYFLWGQAAISIERCMDAGGAYDTAWQVCDKSSAESSASQYTGPVYAGTIDGQSVRLQLRNDTLGYRMITEPLRIVGDLNTLRGFERDDNAVVFVLNASNNVAQQIRFLASKSSVADELIRIGLDDKLSTREVLRAKANEPH